MREKPTMSHVVNVADLQKLNIEWYHEYSERLEGVLKDFVREYCERDESDKPKPADEQDCYVVQNAMKLLDQ